MKPAGTAWEAGLSTLTAAAATTLLAVACDGDGTPLGQSQTSTAAATEQADAYPIGTPTEWLTPELITGSLRAIDQIFPTRTVARAASPSELTRRDAALDVTYRFDGGTHSLADFPERTRTTGLLVLHDGEILHESYHRGADERSRFLSMSVAKSFTSTLLGIARGRASSRASTIP